MALRYCCAARAAGMRSYSLNAIRTATSAAAHSSGPTGLCGPAVRLLIQQYDINHADVKGTGPKHNILKSDVLSFIQSGGLKPLSIKSIPPTAPKTSSAVAAPPTSVGIKPTGSRRNVENYIDIPLSNIRSTIAKRLTLSKKTIPHEYQSTSVRADAIIALRRQLKEDGITLSLNDFIIKAAGLALRAVPEVNVRWSGEAVQLLPTVDISVAVATSSGLITPIVTRADVLGVRDISHRVKELASRARENKLQPHEFQGGSFTISNLGMFGSVDNFTAIINPPQAAILTVGGNRTVVNEDLHAENRFTVTLCYDGRAIDEQSAARFLCHLGASLSDPLFMVVEPLDPALDFDFARLL